MALLKGTLLKGERYQIRKLLARGGFGFVYLTFDELTRREVVLKELIPALVGDVEVLRRFVREGRAMQRLDHPNIARTEAMFKDQGNYYMVLEYVGGGALTDWTDRGRKLSLNQTAMVAVSLCDALTYLHEMGITHCDLNPSNVLFDAEGRPKLVDLGIAHVSDKLVHRSWRTERNLAMGTVFYMPPEQLDGVRDDPRVDLYSLGALLYQLLAGYHYLDFDMRSTPGAQADNVELVRSVKPEPIPDVPPEVSEVILRALEKDPGSRYPDVTTFCQELIRAMFPYLPSEEAIHLVSPFRSNEALLGAHPGAADWPTWVWGALVAVNLAVMLTVAILLIRAS